MSDGVHLLIPFAYSAVPECVRTLHALRLPHLEKLLARLVPQDLDAGDETTLSLAHERVIARECALPTTDGCIPWAAWQVHLSGQDTQGEAWAFITPCHWQVASAHISMGLPEDLLLDEAQSRALLAAMQTYFEQDGIALQYQAPTCWLARGAVFRDLPTASLDRAVGHSVDGWMPRSAQARSLRRLQQEMQMLMYTHATNEDRIGRGLLPVNSFWVSGTGALPATHSAAMPPGLTIDLTLREAALRGDWQAWASAWQRLDAGECTRLLELAHDGAPLRLTLCGERSARTWVSQTSGTWQRRIANLLQPKSVATQLENL